MKQTLIPTFAIASALGLSACAMTPAGVTDAAAPGPSVGAPLHTGTPLVATLSGPAVPNRQGDQDGNGQFALWADSSLNRVCYSLGVGMIDNATSAAVHRGGPGERGPVVVPLRTPTPRQSEGCVDSVDPTLVRDLIANPNNYYVHVLTTTYPNGAIRAQLMREENVR
ncbi:CHRD domain-containing protein [Altericroceibacterium xinjiangense]|uniref:CHRD domain-containing protein n=1 Tax=Altericroceibacterium xinjiangense TaxID=762261 RepID=UPI000F7EB770|nr:CHRD domain-containing protein [Altericroceibacterium xinjiangense]